MSRKTTTAKPEPVMPLAGGTYIQTAKGLERVSEDTSPALGKSAKADAAASATAAPATGDAVA